MTNINEDLLYYCHEGDSTRVKCCLEKGADVKNWLKAREDEDEWLVKVAISELQNMYHNFK